MSEWTVEEIIIDLEISIEKKRMAIIRAKKKFEDMECALGVLKRIVEERENPDKNRRKERRHEQSTTKSN